MARLRQDRTRLVTLLVLAFLLFTTSQGMSASEWAITLMRGLAAGALTFLVAAGLSLIFGLMDVLNLAHGELFMIGAYVGWTVYVRPDTFVDMLAPAAILGASALLWPMWLAWLKSHNKPPLQRDRPDDKPRRIILNHSQQRVAAALAMPAGLAIILWLLRLVPLAIWDAQIYAQSPITYALNVSQGLRLTPPAACGPYTPCPAWVGLLTLLGLFVGGTLLTAGLAGMRHRPEGDPAGQSYPARQLWRPALLALIGLLLWLANDPLTLWLTQVNNGWLFLLAIVTAVGVGFGSGWLIESTLIRPLYDRPMYQIMLTLGVGFIAVEFVRAVWGRPEFTLPKADLFNGSGQGCPATSVGDWLEHQCATFEIWGGRLRTYNEIFIILIGLLVLAGIWLLLQRTRLGLIIRAGVQDSHMVEALGINVRRVFTFVFALGAGLAALGGVLAAPSIGLSNAMGGSFLLYALIALAIGGLTSFPGAAAGALLVGLVQQFMIKYGQIGIQLPFLAEPFKPTPPLVPASTVLLMVVILLVLPNGLFGRHE